MTNEKYTITFDAGKPYDKVVYGEEELKKELTDFYAEHKDSDDFFDVAVLNDKDEDISESQFITEMVGEIMEKIK